MNNCPLEIKIRKKAKFYEKFCLLILKSPQNVGFLGVLIEYFSGHLFLSFFFSLFGVWEDGVLAVATEVVGDLWIEESKIGCDAAVAAVAESDGWDPTGCWWISC